MRQAENEGGRHRAVGPARLPLVVAACSKLLLIVLLISIYSHGWGGEHASARDGVAPLSLRAARLSSRTLMAQPSQEPEMARLSQARLLPPQGPGDGSGSVLLPGLLPLGTPLGPSPSDHLQPSVAACCAACRAVPECTAFWYCSREGGCTEVAQNLTAPHQGCQLVHQNETAPGTGRPVLLVSAPQFVGGAPLRYAATPVEGYDAFPGLGFWYRYDFECSGSVSQPGSCGLDGGPPQVAPRCSADPDCQVMMWFPDGRDYPGAGRPVVLLKGGPGVGPLDVEDANINLNAVLYRKKVPAGAAAGGGGSLSAGAIAGIAVGAACAALALVVAATLLVRQRQRLARHKHNGETSASRDASASSCGMMNGDKTSWAGQSVPATLAMASSATTSLSFGVASSGNMTARTLPASSTELSRLALGPSLEQRAAVPASWPEALSLPPGLEQGVSSAGSGRQPALGGRVCPPAPPPSTANSMAPIRVPPGGAAAGARSQAPAAVRMPLPGAPACGTAGQPLASPRAARSPQAADAASHPLLSQLPTYGWQRCLVDYAAIEFVRDAEGFPVELGSGASATVYQVLLKGVEPHAAKVFRLGSDPRAQLDFLEEASLLRLLRHRSIVGFAGVCVARGHGIILMELMEGGDLRSRNAEVNEWGLRRFGWYQRYTHFDIKSRNVLLSRDLTAKLADVGFTRAMRTTHHSVEGPIGTLDYMSPELLRNDRKCTSAVDIFSFGCLLHEICTGAYPSRGCLRDLHVPLEAPAEVAALVAACLQEDPAQRPTARQLVQTLMALQ